MAYKSLFLALGLAAVVMGASAQVETRWTLTAYTGENLTGGRYSWNGTFANQRMNNYTVGDLTGLVAMPGRLRVTDNIRSLVLTATGSFPQLVKLRLYNATCAAFYYKKGEVELTPGTYNSLASLPGANTTWSAQASGFAVLFNRPNYPYGCGQKQNTTNNGGNANINCLLPANLELPACNTPQACCRNPQTGQIEVYPGSCGPWEQVDCRTMFTSRKLKLNL